MASSLAALLAAAQDQLWQTKLAGLAAYTVASALALRAGSRAVAAPARRLVLALLFVAGNALVPLLFHRKREGVSVAFSAFIITWLASFKALALAVGRGEAGMLHGNSTPTLLLPCRTPGCAAFDWPAPSPGNSPLNPHPARRDPPTSRPAGAAELGAAAVLGAVRAAPGAGIAVRGAAAAPPLSAEAGRPGGARPPAAEVGAAHRITLCRPQHALFLLDRPSDALASRGSSLTGARPPAQPALRTRC